jgi:hypothetical protein
MRTVTAILLTNAALVLKVAKPPVLMLEEVDPHEAVS